MPIVLDESLPPALYPLAFLVGPWRGDGAAQVPGPDGEEVGRRIEQEAEFAPLPSGVMRYRATTWLLDAPAPQPPTTAFGDVRTQDGNTADTNPAGSDAAGPGGSGSGGIRSDEPERTLLTEESGYWRVVPAEGETEPGQGRELEVVLVAGEGSVQVLVGTVTGPRITLQSDFAARTATGDGPTAATRMYGLVQGSLMWVEDAATDTRPLSSRLSVELHRA